MNTKEITLSLGLTIPVAQYETLKPSASITETRNENESDEDLFLRAHTKLWGILEAETAISVAKIMRIKNDTGMLGWARGLAEDLASGNNTFNEAFLQTLKPNKEKTNENW